MASKFVEEEVAQQDEPQISIYTKYEGGRKDSGRVNEEDAKESDKYDDTIIWNDKTWKRSYKTLFRKRSKIICVPKMKKQLLIINNNNNRMNVMVQMKRIDIFCGGDIRN